MMPQQGSKIDGDDMENIHTLSERLLGPDEEEARLLPQQQQQQQQLPIANHDQSNKNNQNFGGGDGTHLPVTLVADDIVVEDPFFADHGAVVGRGGIYNGDSRRNGETSEPTETARTPEYRDAPFAIAFLVQLCMLTGIAMVWGRRALSGQSEKQQEQSSDSNGDETNVTSYYGVLGLGLLTCLSSLGVSAASLQLMTQHAEQLIQASLLASIGLLVVNTVTLFAAEGVTGFALVWLLVLVATCLYAHTVWHRIPFAASTLRTALECLRTNGGVFVLAYLVSVAAMVWVLVWIMAFAGVSSHYYYHGGNSSVGILGVILLVLSYHWTTQVLKNVIHVTVSGVVGTWWFDPLDASSLFSPAIQDSWKRATTYSFGSICMGSLLVAIIQTLQSMARSAWRNNRCGLLLCIVECLLFYIQRVAKYFNKWAMVYVALYGYDYMTSGRKVLELFKRRGWNTIITDNLIYRTVTMVSVVIGVLAGLFGMLIARATGWTMAALAADGVDSDATDGLNIIFLVCFVIGLSISSILMVTLVSATDGVIVCLAEAPQPFEANHSALAQDMMQKWRDVYPEECGF